MGCCCQPQQQGLPQRAGHICFQIRPEAKAEKDLQQTRKLEKEPQSFEGNKLNDQASQLQAQRRPRPAQGRAAAEIKGWMGRRLQEGRR